MRRALDLHRHEVTVRFLEKAVVPPYEGSMIRGAFGRAFKESCCPLPSCGNGCLLVNKCPYGYVFETSPPEDARGSPRTKTFPAPTSDTRSVAERELETLPKGSV